MMLLQQRNFYQYEYVQDYSNSLRFHDYIWMQHENKFYKKILNYYQRWWFNGNKGTFIHLNMNKTTALVDDFMSRLHTNAAPPTLRIYESKTWLSRRTDISIYHISCERNVLLTFVLLSSTLYSVCLFPSYFRSFYIFSIHHKSKIMLLKCFSKQLFGNTGIGKELVRGNSTLHSCIRFLRNEWTNDLMIKTSCWRQNSWMKS